MTSELLSLLYDEQERRCAYGTREGDGRSCDCKFMNPLFPNNPEATGCPEMRAAIWVLETSENGTLYMPRLS